MPRRYWHGGVTLLDLLERFASADMALGTFIAALPRDARPPIFDRLVTAC